MFDSQEFYNVSKHLFCSFEWTVGPRKLELLLVNVHFRAAPNAVALRKRQSRLIHHWIDGPLKAGRNVIVLGDINTDETFETTTKEGDLGTLRGLNTAATDDDLIDLFAFYKASQGNTPDSQTIRPHSGDAVACQATPGVPGLELRSMDIRRDVVIRGAGQDKDHMDQFWTIPEAERDISDHYPVVAEFELKP